MNWLIIETLKKTLKNYDKASNIVNLHQLFCLLRESFRIHERLVKKEEIHYKKHEYFVFVN
jgi:hypothetical protein